MKKFFLLLGLTLGMQSSVYAADLLEVYQQALSSDPTYQQAISQQLSTSENLPISIASLLPNLSATGVPTITRTGNAGASVAGPSIGGVSTQLLPRNVTTRAYTMTLSLTQTVFDYTQFANVATSLAQVRGADATLNAALQSLMLRTTIAYLAILRDKDNLSYTQAQVLAFKEQLDQVNQQYEVGLKTITDVYTAKARYEQAISDNIAAETNLSNDRENLRVITGKYYPSIATLSEKFPLLTPKPNDVELWVKKSTQQNWDIRASQYNVQAARDTIHQQFGGHLPTVQLTGSADRQYEDTSSGYNNDITTRNGASTQTNKEIGLNITVPLFEGGQVVAQTNQAKYNYQVAEQQLEFTLRSTVNATRQSYLNIISGISKIKADKEAIISNRSSLEGMRASYKVGTETLVDVLNQQQIYFQAQTQYSKDRYDFVNNILVLKKSAGTLSFDDLRALNGWLVDRQTNTKSPIKTKAKTKAKKKPVKLSAKTKHKVKTKHIKHA